MTGLPYSDRVLHPESSCEAKSLALMVMRDLYGIDILDPDDMRPGNLADRVMRKWDQDTDLDIPVEVAVTLRCGWCHGNGVPEAAAPGEVCPSCYGDGWRLT